MIKVLTEQALKEYLKTVKIEEAEQWTQVSIAPDPAKPDEADYPLYGSWYFRFKPGSRAYLRTSAEVSKRFLDKANEEALLALKSGLIDGVEI